MKKIQLDTLLEKLDSSTNEYSYEYEYEPASDEQDWLQIVIENKKHNIRLELNYLLYADLPFFKSETELSEDASCSDYGIYLEQDPYSQAYFELFIKSEKYSVFDYKEDVTLLDSYFSNRWVHEPLSSILHKRFGK